MQFHSAYRNKDGDAERFVFSITPEVFAVVKTFGHRPLATVKLWDLSSSSLDKTVSYWSTNERFKPSMAEIEDARDVALRLFLFAVFAV